MAKVVALVEMIYEVSFYEGMEANASPEELADLFLDDAYEDIIDEEVGTTLKVLEVNGTKIDE